MVRFLKFLLLVLIVLNMAALYVYWSLPEIPVQKPQMQVVENIKGGGELPFIFQEDKNHSFLVSPVVPGGKSVVLSSSVSDPGGNQSSQILSETTASLPPKPPVSVPASIDTTGSKSVYMLAQISDSKALFSEPVVSGTRKIAESFVTTQTLGIQELIADSKKARDLLADSSQSGSQIKTAVFESVSLKSETLTDASLFKTNQMTLLTASLTQSVLSSSEQVQNPKDVSSVMSSFPEIISTSAVQTAVRSDSKVGFSSLQPSALVSAISASQISSLPDKLFGSSESITITSKSLKQDVWENAAVLEHLIYNPMNLSFDARVQVIQEKNLLQVRVPQSLVENHAGSILVQDHLELWLYSSKISLRDGYGEIPWQLGIDFSGGIQDFLGNPVGIDCELKIERKNGFVYLQILPNQEIESFNLVFSKAVWKQGSWVQGLLVSLSRDFRWGNRQHLIPWKK